MLDALIGGIFGLIVDNMPPPKPVPAPISIPVSIPVVTQTVSPILPIQGTQNEQPK